MTASNQTWITDANGNKCSIEYFASEEAARKALASLTNCRDCTNCRNCTDCVSCNLCSDCTACTGCDRCSLCAHCDRCSLSFDCDNCVGISNWSRLSRNPTWGQITGKGIRWNCVINVAGP